MPPPPSALFMMMLVNIDVKILAQGSTAFSVQPSKVYKDDLYRAPKISSNKEAAGRLLVAETSRKFKRSKRNRQASSRKVHSCTGKTAVS